MAGRIAVTAVAASTVAIVGGIVGVVALTDAGARADDAGSRVSVAHIDVAAPSHPSPTVVPADADIPTPDAGAVTVPAPEPGVVATKQPSQEKTSGSAHGHGSAPARNDQNSGADQNSGGQNDQGGQHARSTTQSGRDGWLSHSRLRDFLKTQSRMSSPDRRD
ncbi:hypothetical protein [Microbacterium candidum]|uniref:Uncharacterized protein n=1 Tax=Microbacterium candidum TaxID=3041922 RepID=A0ABT7N276_9MICO|nr:hypothetical protein [Microbacterium sp. ASV49]MDL9980776.1 hypothetical protein [Microbacterium sp. ASV49]